MAKIGQAVYTSRFYNLNDEKDREVYYYIGRSLNRLKLKDMVHVYLANNGFARFENVVISSRKNNWRHGFLTDNDFKRVN